MTLLPDDDDCSGYSDSLHLRDSKAYFEREGMTKRNEDQGLRQKSVLRRPKENKKRRIRVKKQTRLPHSSLTVSLLTKFLAFCLE